MKRRYGGKKDLILKFAVALTASFIAEICIMLLFFYFDIVWTPLAYFLDPLVLVIVMAPFIYLLFIRPAELELAKKETLMRSLDRRNRQFRMLSDCNQVLVRADDENRLMEDICRHLTEIGGYRMAWIGIKENDPGKTVRPAAFSGHDGGYVSGLKITWDDTERGRGPTGTAVRENRVIVCRYIDTDPAFALWRHEALKRGYASSVAIPLRDGQSALGALNIYSTMPDAFDEEELGVLTELAADLSFGIQHLRTKVSRERAERELEYGYRMLKIFLQAQDDEMYAKVLEIVLEAMKSRYGLFGYIDENGDAVYPSMTREVHKDCRLDERHVAIPKESWSRMAMWKEALIDGKTVFKNSPFRVPEGHVPISRCLSAPVVYQDRVIGHLQVANKETDYGDDDTALLERLAATIAPDMAGRLEKQAAGKALDEAQKRLDESASRLNEILSLVSEGIYMLNSKGQLEFINPAAERMLGWKAEELIGKDFHAAMQHISKGEEKHTHACPLKESVAAGESYQSENDFFRKKDGDYFPVEILSTPVIRDGKFIEGAVVAFSDISLRKSMEERLRASEEMYRGIVDNMLIGASLTNFDGDVIYANEALAKMNEFESMEEFIAAGAKPRCKNPEDRLKVIAELKKFGKIDGFEAELVTRTGKTITVLISSVHVGDLFSSLVLDITRRKKAEEELRKSMGRLAKAQAIAHLGDWDWDLETDKTTWADETFRIFGYEPGAFEPTFEKFMESIHPEDRKIIEVYREKIYSEKPSMVDFDLMIVRPDGEIRYVNDRIKILYNEKGMPYKYEGINLDITERKRIETDLCESNKKLKATLETLEKSSALLVRQEKLASIGTLSAGVAHEILNPLNVIGTIAQVLLKDQLTKELKEHLEEVMVQVRRATKITNNLRMFAHVHKREIMPVDIHALFDKTASLLEHDLNLDNIMVDRSYCRDLPIVHVDQDLMAQVFLNILNNASHALQEVEGQKQKLISIQTKAYPENIEIRLFNNGPTIPDENINRIFDPFFTTKDPDKGTGLGLSMANSFIQDFGGTITVQNVGNEGVAFVISLPVRKKEEEE